MAQSIIRDLRQFLKRPNELPPRMATTGTKLKELGLMLVIYLVAMLLVSIPIMVIESQGWLGFEDHAVQQLLDQMPVMLVLVLAVVVIPLLEELVFRLPLRFRRNIFLRTWVSISSGFGEKDEEDTTAAAKNWWNRSYGWIFYLTAFIFGLIHITNFNQEDSNFWMFVPFLIMPQFVGGLLIGYLRLRNGFYWGYFLHAGNNFIFLGATLLFADNFEKISESTSDYVIKIEEASFTTFAQTSFRPGTNKLDATAIPFQTILAHALKQPTYRIEIAEELSMPKKLNVKLKCLNREFDCKALLLEKLSQVYSISIDSIEKTINGFDMAIIQAQLLHPHQHPDPSNLTSKISTTNAGFSLENYPIKNLAHFLSSHFKMPFEYHDLDSARYDFTLPKTDVESLRNALQNEYGIKLKEKESRLMYYQVVNESGH